MNYSNVFYCFYQVLYAIRFSYSHFIHQNPKKLSFVAHWSECIRWSSHLFSPRFLSSVRMFSLTYITYLIFAIMSTLKSKADGVSTTIPSVSAQWRFYVRLYFRVVHVFVYNELHFFVVQVFSSVSVPFWGYFLSLLPTIVFIFSAMSLYGWAITIQC